MTRIIAGTAGGRTINVPAVGTRPTSDRVREGVFSRLDHLIDLVGISVIDLFAGSGALGLEAASRGASPVVLVESAAAAARVCQANAARLGLTVEVLQMSAERFAARPACGQPAHLILIDPPYDYPEASLASLLTSLDSGGHLADQALVVVERSSRGPAPNWPTGWRELDPRRYGETIVWFASTPGPRPSDSDSSVVALRPGDTDNWAVKPGPSDPGSSASGPRWSDPDNLAPTIRPSDSDYSAPDPRRGVG